MERRLTVCNLRLFRVDAHDRVLNFNIQDMAEAH